MSLKIVFMGTPEFSIPTLEMLLKKKINILKIYTQSPKKSKRGQKVNISPVQEFSEKNKLNFRIPEKLNTDDEFNIFKDLSPDLVVVVAYGKLIPKKFLSIPKLGFINIHASLLPKWRGAAPIQRAMINGDEKTGVSIMKIEEKLDSGPVLSSEELNLNKSDTFGDVYKKLSVMGAELLSRNLENIESYNTNIIKQDESKATYAKKINKNETQIKWNLSADKVMAHIHGLSPNPGAWFSYENERYKVLKVKKLSMNGNSGQILDENLIIGCKTESIQILEIQREGKKKQNIKNFLLGQKIKKDTVII